MRTHLFRAQEFRVELHFFHLTEVERVVFTVVRMGIAELGTSMFQVLLVLLSHVLLQVSHLLRVGLHVGLVLSLEPLVLFLRDI